ncbi:MAG: protein kinase [Cyanobacteria bacterium SZAS LIN-3]|nr:protein kinase [Cyanobacteria bacterium SZAS LIN-3]MBS2007403.1 protein kinase [Cyanobacteria bacterium SZAS TMP-1]
MDFKELEVDQIKLSAMASGVENFCSDAIADFEILDRLGEGSITTVYKARRSDADEVFAAKVLRSQYAENPRTAKRFAMEAKKAVLLNHAHLVSVYATGNTAAGLPYLICDFIDGGSLGERLAQVGRMGQTTVIDLFLALCEGLELAHSKNIFHRDIKPGNIVFTGDGKSERVKLADFGIAKVLPSAGRETKYFTPDGDAFGNPAYMCPEQLEGQRLDARSDIYSLGCVMYECLSGRPPFEGQNGVQIALKQMQVDPDFEVFRQLNISVESNLQLVMSGMLAKSPADRYQTVAALAADLRRVKSGGRPKYRPPPLKAVPPVSAKPAAVAPPPSSSGLRTAEEELGPKRSPIVFDMSLAKHSLEISEPLERHPLERTDAKVSAAPVKAWPLGQKASLTIAAAVCVFVGLAAGFCMMMASTPLADLDPDRKVYEAGVPEVPKPRFYSLQSWEQRDYASDQAPKALLTRDGRVIFWYQSAYLREALSEAAKNGVDMSFADLSHSDLRNARLANAKLRGADMSHCRLDGAILAGADLRGADMSDSTSPYSEFAGF